MSRASRQRLARQRTRRMQVIGASIVVLVGVVVVAALMGNRGSSAPAAGITVSMTDYAFQPAPIEVGAGHVRFTVVNHGDVAHDLVLPELGKGTADQRPGSTASFDVELRPGTYIVVCDLPGHRAAGMETQLIVR